MSGLFGIVDPAQRADYSETLIRMGRSMAHYPWYQVDTYQDPLSGIYLGHIGIGIFNRDPQPVWSQDGTVSAFLTGEFTNASEVRFTLEKHGVGPVGSSDLELFLSLYLERGEQCICDLKGSFVVAIWDERRNQLIIGNDRFGLYNTFYTKNHNRFIFAPEVKGVLCPPSVRPHLDRVALAEYMRFQYLLGERTFFEDIKLLPKASILVFDITTASLRINPYWSYDQILDRREVSFTEAVAETGRILRETVRRQTADALRPGIYLSGGLDSRTILGLTTRRPITTINFGVKDCRDKVLAQKIARKSGSDHYWYEFQDGSWVQEIAPLHLELTEGFHSWIHAHGMSTLPQARSMIDVNLTGWGGGITMGDDDCLSPLLVNPVDDDALITHLFSVYNQKYTWPSLNEPEEYLLYKGTWRKEMRGLAFDSLYEHFQPYKHMRPDTRAELFLLDNYCNRLTKNMVVFQRSHFEVRFPFYDYDFIDFVYSLPAEMRRGRLFYRSIIQQEIPQLAYIPYDHDELLPTTHRLIRNSHKILIRLKNRVNRHIRPIFPDYPTLYADYENYLRGDLMSWAEGILFSSQVDQHGIFDKKYLHTLFDHHLSRKEEWTIGKIAPIMTYEMMLTRFLD